MPVNKIAFKLYMCNTGCSHNAKCIPHNWLFLQEQSFEYIFFFLSKFYRQFGKHLDKNLWEIYCRKIICALHFFRSKRTHKISQIPPTCRNYQLHSIITTRPQKGNVELLYSFDPFSTHTFKISHLVYTTFNKCILSPRKLSPKIQKEKCKYMY